LLLDDEAGLFGTWPPAPGAPVLPWLPEVGPELADGIGDPMLPGAALVELGKPGPGVLPGIGDVIVLGAEDIGRGAIVIVLGIAPGVDEAGIACAPPDVPVPACAPRATAVARQTYVPVPLPHCAEPFA